jgi:hypothetical protein
LPLSCRDGYIPGMTFVPALVVAFAAFCIGLALRIVNQGEWWAK